MEERLIELLRHARRWNENGSDYLPTLGCSKCGAGCMPLCGLGVNPHVSPMESKDLHFRTRKTMLEVGQSTPPVAIQIVTATAVVVQFERAMECVEERVVDGVERQLFVRPIPTLRGLLCSECAASVCQVCMGPADADADTITFGGRTFPACLFCSERCDRCKRQRLKHHTACCEAGGGGY